jgi:hypothetical protein
MLKQLVESKRKEANMTKKGGAATGSSVKE